MAYNITLSDKAIEEIEQTFNWYENKKQGLGTDFMVEVYDYLDIISQSPKIFPIDFKIYRKAVLKKFSKYVIIYSFENNEVFVLSLFNTLQNPEKQYRIR